MATENSKDAVNAAVSKEDQQETKCSQTKLPESTVKSGLPEDFTKTDENIIAKMPTIKPVFKPKCRIPVAQLIKMSTSSDEESDDGKLFNNDDDDDRDVVPSSSSGNQAKQLKKLRHTFNDLVQINAAESSKSMKLSRQLKNRAKKDRRKADKMKKMLENPSLFDDQLCKIVNKMGSMDVNKHNKNKHKHKKRKKERHSVAAETAATEPRVLLEVRDICEKLINIINEDPKRESSDSLKVSLGIDEHKLIALNKFRDCKLGVRMKKKKKKGKKHHHKYQMMKIQELLSRQIGLREVLEERLQNKDL